MSPGFHRFFLLLERSWHMCKIASIKRCQRIKGFPGGSAVKIQPAMQDMQETQVWYLGQKESLEKGMASYFSIFAWKNPMDRGSWWATVHGVTKSQAWLSTWAQNASEVMEIHTNQDIFPNSTVSITKELTSSLVIPRSCSGKESAYQCKWYKRFRFLIPGLGTSPGVGNGNPLQYSYLENFMGRGAWWAIVHGVTHDGALHMYILYTGDSVVKNPAANAGNVGSIPGSERSPGEGNGNPFQYYCWENLMDRGGW